MKNIVFCQFHNKLINGKYEKNIADLYYNGIYKYKYNEGYYKTDAFFELPLWIAEIKGSLTSAFNSELCIIDSVKACINDLNNREADFICFSVLDVNKAFIHAIIKGYRGKAQFVLGGYIDFTGFKNYDNVLIFNSIKAFIEHLGIEYKYNLDYSLFKGYKTIPRLTLSKGCTNRCKFCIVERDITTLSKRDILKQIKAFEPLKFKLVYLNDKTLGQAENYKLLPLIYKRIKKYNPNFKGFIIQTTCNMLLKAEFISNIKNSHIYACEIGIETYNNNILQSLRKPQNTKIIDKAMKILKNLHIKIIPNIIIGLIGENKASYNNTLNFINKHRQNIFLLNIYNLALYLKSDLAKDITVKNDNDLSEHSLNKSFYSKKQVKDNTYFYNQIFNIGIEILKNK